LFFFWAFLSCESCFFSCLLFFLDFFIERSVSFASFTASRVSIKYLEYECCWSDLRFRSCFSDFLVCFASRFSSRTAFSSSVSFSFPPEMIFDNKKYDFFYLFGTCSKLALGPFQIPFWADKWICEAFCSLSGSDLGTHRQAVFGWCILPRDRSKLESEIKVNSFC